MRNIHIKAPLKAIILAAGLGSRISPLTDNCPKSLLQIGGKTILEMMIAQIQENGINDVTFVLGYLQQNIMDHVKTNFPELNAQFITNPRYTETNTGYSLMLAIESMQGTAFVKFDADVVFDSQILKILIESDAENCLCIDKNINLDAEEIKVIIDKTNRVLKASKTVNPKDAIGESIGIEKISSHTSRLLLAELQSMMKDDRNLQEYYEGAYERLIDKNVTFQALDITGLKWTEIDTKEDFKVAENLFRQGASLSQVA